jgi:uncharacterized protein YerC
VSTSVKINRVKLKNMLNSGKSQKECAEHFGVSESAISQAKKELSVAVVKNVAMESAPKVIEKNLNAIAQLQDINRKANTLLDVAIKAKDHGTALNAMREIRGQLSLQLEVFKTLYDMEAVAEFQREVLETIAEVNPEVRDRIVKALKESRAVRQAIDIT